MHLDDIVRKKAKLHFLLCGSCFWCASLLGNRPVQECPRCREAKLESIPIARGERCRLEFSEKRGMLLDFA